MGNDRSRSQGEQSHKQVKLFRLHQQKQQDDRLKQNQGVELHAGAYLVVVARFESVYGADQSYNQDEKKCRQATGSLSEQDG